MGYGLFDGFNHLHEGYMVPAYCDFPGCQEKIYRGLGYKCEKHYYFQFKLGDQVRNDYPDDGEDWEEVEIVDEGCGLFFCGEHEGHGSHGDLQITQPEHPEWLTHLLTHKSWKRWREENPYWVGIYEKELANPRYGPWDDTEYWEYQRLEDES